MHHRHGRAAGPGGMIGSGVAVNFGNEYYNPPTPHEIPVRGFTHGQRLRLVLVPVNSGDFTVNLKSPQDIHLHYNVRFSEQSVVRNSTHHGAWQNEERHSQGFPFQLNKVYTLEFINSNGEVIVNLNGHPFTQFRERYPGHDINAIEVNGNVVVHSAHVTNA